MPTYTPNLNLKKPDAGEFYSIEDANSNMNKIDTAVKSKADIDPGTSKVKADQLPTVGDALQKTTIVDADSVSISDSADTDKSKRVLWSSIKTTLKTWLDTLYASVGHTHAWSVITGKPNSFAPSAHASTHQTGGADAITPAGIGAAKASHTHAQSEVTGLAADILSKSNWNGAIITGSAKAWAASAQAVNNGAADTSVTDTPYSGYWIMRVHKSTPAGWIKLEVTNVLNNETWYCVSNAGNWSEWKAAPVVFGPASITISATWSGTGPWTQSIAVAGVLAAWDWRLGLHLAKITDDAARKLQEKAFACITWCETYDGGITLTSRDKKPDVAISAVLAGEV